MNRTPAAWFQTKYSATKLIPLTYAEGIGPPSQVYKTRILPLNYAYLNSPYRIRTDVSWLKTSHFCLLN